MNPRVKTIPLAKTEFTQAVGVKARYGDERYVLHHLKQLDSRASLACQFAERWAMVAAMEDGEDSAGRQKVRRMTPGELADHACECVSALMEQFQVRGWLLEVPNFEQVVDDLARLEEADLEKTVEPPPTSAQVRARAALQAEVNKLKAAQSQEQSQAPENPS